MTKEAVSPILRQLRRMVARQTVKDRSDLELIQQFADRRDESAFTALVERYGALVWGVCQRVLRDHHDAEDAFQATFLVLARQAGSVCKKEAAGSWLYGVAYRTALSQRRAAQRRRQREKQGQVREPEQPVSAASLRELQDLLDEEVARLPAKYRAPFVLCCLEGKSHADTARELGCKDGTVASRIAKARQRLRHRLLRRGVTLSSALCAAALSPTAEAAPPALVAATIEGVLLSLSGTATAALSAQAVTLANGVTKMFSATIWKFSAIVLLATSSLACVGLFRRADPLAQPLEALGVSERMPLAHAAGSDDKPGLANAETRKEAEMHVIGVYSAKNRGEEQRGSVQVEVRRTTKPVVLVLTSYFSVEWHVKLAPGARIKKAIVSGYFAQEIKGLPADVPVANWSYFPGDGSRRKEGWFYAFQWNTLGWREMVRILNRETGLPLSSFQGEYSGESFIVDGKRGRDQGQNGLIPRPRMNKELTPKELLAASADAELHVVGIGTPASDHRANPVDVEVRRAAKPVVLVLAGGDSEQSLYKGQKVAERLKELTELPVATFQGQEKGTSFVVDGKRGRITAPKQVKEEEDPLADVADVPSQELRAGGDADKRYFLIGPKKDARQPANGYGLLVILPGGDGSADFHPFVKRIYKNALSDRYLVAQPVAVRWTANQRIVWPTKTSRVAKMKFSTEEFVEAVIQDVAKKHKLDSGRVFTLYWSSSSPAAYVISLQDKSSVKGSFIAMSVFNPRFLPSLKAAKGHAYYLYHSPDDSICPYRMAEQAKTLLGANGAKVRLETYEGGHGWRGGLYAEIRRGVDWLEKQQEKASKP